jgi:CDP-glycerol glycerophosphotransferase (TagB/SpsB family)
MTWILSKFVAQDPDLVVFTSFHGDGFRGNTRRSFEWLHSEEGISRISGKKVVWLSRNRQLVNELQSMFGHSAAVNAHSLKGALLLVKSKVALLTHGTSDYPFMNLPKRIHLIQTYHGLPTKRGEFMLLDGEADLGPIASYFLNRRFQPIDTFLSTSDFVTEIFSKRFGLPKERFLKIGFPVYDELIERVPDPDWMKSVYPKADASTKLVIYAPTFRYKSATQLFPFLDMDTGDLSRFLEHNNLVLAIRTHPNDKVVLPQWFASIDRIVITTDKIIEQVNDLIVHSSAIITDYSSIYLEGLLRDIPPIFIPYDLKEYERGFPFEYADATPGPHVGSYIEWKNAIQDALNGAKAYQEHRKRVRNLFFERTDADSTVRLWEYIARL